MMRGIYTWSLLAVLVIAPLAVADVIPVDADAYIQGGSSTTNFGSVTQLLVKQDDSTATTYDRMVYLRFDLTSASASFTDASLHLNFVDSGAGTLATSSLSWVFHVYGLNDGNAGENWVESNINWSNAPGHNTSGYAVTASATTDLGTFAFTGKTATVDFTSAALKNFITADTNDLVTFIILRDTQGTGSDSYVHAIASKENSDTDGATLTIIPEPASAALLLGAIGLLTFSARRRIV